jgi:hypothetical protein
MIQCAFTNENTAKNNTSHDSFPLTTFLSVTCSNQQWWFPAFSHLIIYEITLKSVLKSLCVVYAVAPISRDMQSHIASERVY